MDKRGSFVGQLYRGDPQTKSWAHVVSGQVTIRLVEGGSGAAGEWKLSAYKKDNKVWDCRLDPGIKFRVKNDFLQWQTKGGGGETVTYGIRLKDQETAAQLSDKIGEVLNALLSKAPEGDEVQIRVLCSGRDPSLLTIRNSTTMIQLLRMYCHKKQMDSSQYIISLPPDSPHPPVKPSTTAGSLKTKEIQVIRKGTKPPSSAPPPVPPTTAPPTESTDGGKLGPFEQLLQVELPRDERTVVRVSSLMTIAELLRYICEKRNLDVTDHRFDLPATEESLAGKTLEQLKLKAIRVVLRDGAKRREEQPSPHIETRSPSRSNRKSTKKNKLETVSNESPKANRRQAPPPPPPLQSRRTQPNLIKELSVATEKKATLRRTEMNSDPECTPPEARHTNSIGGSYPPPVPRKDFGAGGSESSIEGTPEQERKPKVPLLPNTSRTALLPKCLPAPPPPSKTTPTAETTHDEDISNKGPAPPPVANKPKKKRLKSFDETDGQDSAPQATPISPEEDTIAAVQTVDMDALMDEAVPMEPAVKKVKKKVKRKPGSDDPAAAGQKEKKAKSGKTTKKKKKVDKQKDAELPREESVEREEKEEEEASPQSPPPELPSAPPPPLSSNELPQEDKQPDQYQDGRQLDLPPPPSTTSLSLKLAPPDIQQKHTSLKRRPRGPAPPPPPPGSKTMTLGRIRPGESDIITKSRGLTLNGIQGEGTGRPSSDDITTKPRSVSDALPPVTSSSPAQFGTRNRPSRKAPSRPAPSTPQGREKAKIDEGKSRVDQRSEVETKRRSGSLSGSPRRPPPMVPANVSPVIPPAHSSDLIGHSDATKEIEGDREKAEREDGNLSRGSDESGRGKDEPAASYSEADEDQGEESLPSTTSTPPSKPPSTPPKPTPQPPPRQSPPGQSPSPSGRRKEAATVVCKDTEDGGKELIIKPSPHSKRRLAGPLIFKMPPPPSTPPNKSKSKKPPKLAAKPERRLGKTGDSGSAAAAVSSLDDRKIDLESADSSFGESISESAGLGKAQSPKSLNDTLVSNEFTNLDELLSDSQHDIVTTDFSFDENLEPVDENGELEWNESGLADSEIPCHDPEIEAMTDLYCHDNDLSDNAAAALNFNSNNNNNNNNNLGADDKFDYRDLPPPVEVPPPPPGDDSDEWERDSNRTGELNFDSSSSDDEHSTHKLDDGEVALEEEEGPGGVVLLNVKKVEDDVAAPVLPEEDEADKPVEKPGQTSSSTEESTHLSVPASIPRDPSIGAQLSELDDVVSSLAELAAEVPVVAPPSPPPPPPPSLSISSHPGPLTSSTPTHKKAGERRSVSPEPPPIPQTLPPQLTPSDDEDEFPLGPPPPLITSEPPSLTPSPPSSPATNQRRDGSRDEEEEEEVEDFANNEVLNRLKQRKIKPSSTWRRRRGSKEQSLDDGGESELLEKLKERQAKYRSKGKARHTEETSESVDTSGTQGPSSIPGGMGMGPGGGDNVQVQLQFLQQQVLQQQMLQLQQQFQQMQNYALQQGVTMPPNLMVPGGAMLSQQQPGFMTTPMAPPTGTAGLPQQMVMQTSAGPVLVPATSMPQMVPGQGVIAPNQQLPTMIPQGQIPAQPSLLQGQANVAIPPPPAHPQQLVYGQGVPQVPVPAQPPLMSTSVASDNTTLPASSRPVNLDTLAGRPDSQDSRTGEEDTSKRSAKVEARQGTSSSMVTLSRVGIKKRSEDVRALVLGPLEEQFDSLMDQVRDANPTDVLKKVPEDEEKEPSSSYTGMAAALAEALKQRRLHVDDTRRSLDESNSSDWQSP